MKITRVSLEKLFEGYLNDSKGEKYIKEKNVDCVIQEIAEKYENVGTKIKEDNYGKILCVLSVTKSRGVKEIYSVRIKK